MANAFDVAMRAIFTDPNMATSALYRVGGWEQAKAVRILLRAPDEQQSWAASKLVSDTMVIEVQVAEVAEPLKGDTFEVGSQLYRVQGEPLRDGERLVWQAEVRPL
jgi:hypothetical protein